jgi:uncharacterized membrane protein
MSNNNNNNNSGTSGIGFTGVLTIVFIVLKLLGVINWSWLWVLSPLWISLIIAGILWAIFASIALKARNDFFRPRKG